MVRIFKKVLSLILSVTIVASSAGVTMLNHFCKEEQKVFIGVEGIYHNKCSHHNELPSCCEHQSLNDESTQKNTTNKHKIKPYDDCCQDQKIIQKIIIYSSERNWQKVLDLIRNYVSIEYIKVSISEYLDRKIEVIETKILNPIKKIIRFIRTLTRIVTSSENPAL